MIEIKINSWDEFDNCLKTNFTGKEFVLRNFQRVVFDNIGEEEEEEINNLQLVMDTGTDRRNNSPLWNVKGFDYDHDTMHSGIEADQIIYARKFRIIKVLSKYYCVFVYVFACLSNCF